MRLTLFSLIFLLLKFGYALDNRQNTCVDRIINDVCSRGEADAYDFSRIYGICDIGPSAISISDLTSRIVNSQKCKDRRSEACAEKDLSLVLSGFCQEGSSDYFYRNIGKDCPNSRKNMQRIRELAQQFARSSECHKEICEATKIGQITKTPHSCEVTFDGFVEATSIDKVAKCSNQCTSSASERYKTKMSRLAEMARDMRDMRDITMLGGVSPSCQVEMTHKAARFGTNVMCTCSGDRQCSLKASTAPATGDDGNGTKARP